MSIAIDTHKTITKLKERGFTQEQAEGVVDVLTESELLTRDFFKAELYRALLIHGGVVVAFILAGSQIIN